MTRYQIIWSVIRKIPYGRVASYGQIALLAGFEGMARQVGYALHATPPKSGVPWHRVINSQGRISLSGPSARLQRRLLQSEGILFSTAGKIDMKKFQWKKTSPRKREMLFFHKS
jgi:methylated-DNA-protein-cysteine methyltransferase related protein